jgi:hypothetical protein
MLGNTDSISLDDGTDMLSDIVYIFPGCDLSMTVFPPCTFRDYFVSTLVMLLYVVRVVSQT